MKIGYLADGPRAHEAFKKLLVDETLENIFIMARYDKQDKVLMNYEKEMNSLIGISPAEMFLILYVWCVCRDRRQFLISMVKKY